MKVISTKEDYNIKFGEVYRRMNYLVRLAFLVFRDNKKLSADYLKQARIIARRNALRLYQLD